MVQPKIGNWGDPLHFQVAQVKEDAFLNPDTYDFEDVDAYELGGGNDQTNIQVDSNFTSLTARALGYATIPSPATGKTPALPYGTDPNPDGFNLDIKNVSQTNSRFKFPDGNFMVILQAAGTGFTTVGPGSPWNISMPEGGTWEPLINEVLAGVGPSTYTQSTKGILVNAGSQGNVLQLSMNATTVAFATMFIAPVQQEGQDAPSNTGYVGAIRPTAMSALVTYTGPTLTDGGNIAAALVPGSSIQSNFLTNNPEDPGTFREWSNLATLTEAEHDGRLSKGAYVTWTQEEDVDFDFLTPEQAQKWLYNAIVVSGTFNPGGSTVEEGSTIARAIIDIQFEIRTEKNLLQKEYCVGSQSCIDMANQMSLAIPFAMENETHMETFKRYFGYVAKAAEMVQAVGSLLA